MPWNHNKNTHLANNKGVKKKVTSATLYDISYDLQVKAGSVKQEFEKQDELRRSAMRAVAALLAVPEVERSPSMAEFANQIRSNADMASIYQSVQGGEAGGFGPTDSKDMS